MTVPIRHKACGGIAMWYVGPTAPPSNVPRSRDVRYVDGTQPKPGDPYLRICPACHGRINGLSETKRCFGEDLDPGFEINPPTTK